MSAPVVLEFEGVTLRLAPRDTPTARALLEALPLEASVERWGDEVFFDASADCALEAGATSVVEPGEIAYWPSGGVIAIGFGPTPMSRAGEIRLAAPINIWAHALDDVRKLSEVAAGSRVRARLEA